MVLRKEIEGKLVISNPPLPEKCLDDEDSLGESFADEKENLTSGTSVGPPIMDALTGIQEGGDIYHMEVDRTTASRKRKIWMLMARSSLLNLPDNMGCMVSVWPYISLVELSSHPMEILVYKDCWYDLYSGLFWLCLFPLVLIVAFMFALYLPFSCCPPSLSVYSSSLADFSLLALLRLYFWFYIFFCYLSFIANLSCSPLGWERSSSTLGCCIGTLLCIYDLFMTWLHRLSPIMPLDYKFSFRMVSYVDYPMAVSKYL